MRFEQDESKPIVGFMPDHSDQVGLEEQEGINLFGEAVRGELWGRCGRLPISASITRAARPRTCPPDVEREEGGEVEAAKCIQHVKLQWVGLQLHMVVPEKLLPKPW